MRHNIIAIQYHVHVHFRFRKDHMMSMAQFQFQQKLGNLWNSGVRFPIVVTAPLLHNHYQKSDDDMSDASKMAFDVLNSSNVHQAQSPQGLNCLSRSITVNGVQSPSFGCPCVCLCMFITVNFRVWQILEFFAEMYIIITLK